MAVTYKIGEAAALLNVKTYVLRFWETEFPQIVPLRTEKGQRLYAEEHLALLSRIRFLLHERGLTIEGARKVLAEEAARGVRYNHTPGQGAQKFSVDDTHAADTGGSDESMGIRGSLSRDAVFTPSADHAPGPSLRHVRVPDAPQQGEQAVDHAQGNMQVAAQPQGRLWAATPAKETTGVPASLAKEVSAVTAPPARTFMGAAAASAGAAMETAGSAVAPRPDRDALLRDIAAELEDVADLLRGTFTGTGS